MADQLKINMGYSNNQGNYDSNSFGLYPPLVTRYWHYVTMTWTIGGLYATLITNQFDKAPDKLQIIFPFFHANGRNPWNDTPTTVAQYENYNSDDPVPDFTGTSGCEIELEFATEADAASALTRWNNLTNRRIEYFIRAGDGTEFNTTDIVALFGNPTTTQISDILQFSWAADDYAEAMTDDDTAADWAASVAPYLGTTVNRGFRIAGGEELLAGPRSPWFFLDDRIYGFQVPGLAYVEQKDMERDRQVEPPHPAPHADLEAHYVIKPLDFHMENMELADQWERYLKEVEAQNQAQRDLMEDAEVTDEDRLLWNIGANLLMVEDWFSSFILGPPQTLWTGEFQFGDFRYDLGTGPGDLVEMIAMWDVDPEEYPKWAAFWRAQDDPEVMSRISGLFALFMAIKGRGTRYPQPIHQRPAGTMTQKQLAQKAALRTVGYAGGGATAATLIVKGESIFRKIKEIKEYSQLQLDRSARLNQRELPTLESPEVKAWADEFTMTVHKYQAPSFEEAAATGNWFPWLGRKKRRWHTTM